MLTEFLQDLSLLEAVGLIAMGILTLILFFKFFGRQTLPYYARDFLLTDGEMPFYEILVKAVGSKYHICPKVRLADIVHCDEHDWKRGFGPMISSKHIDFVLMHPKTSEIQLCIELDDLSHDLPERQARDEFVEDVFLITEVPFLRVRMTKQYNPSEIKRQIKDTIRGY